MDVGEKRISIPLDFMKHLGKQSIFKWDGVSAPSWRIELTNSGVSAFIQWKNTIEPKKKGQKRKYDQICQEGTHEKNEPESLPSEETEEIVVKEEPADEFFTGEEKIEEIENEADSPVSESTEVQLMKKVKPIEALAYKNGCLTRLLAIREEIDRGLNLSKVIRRLMNIVFDKEELLVESIKNIKSKDKIEMIIQEGKRWYNCSSADVRQIISFRLSEIRKTNIGKLKRSNPHNLLSIDDIRRMQNLPSSFRVILPKPEPTPPEEATVTELC